jgi:hypothetical protein
MSVNTHEYLQNLTISSANTFFVLSYLWLKTLSIIQKNHPRVKWKTIELLDKSNSFRVTLNKPKIVSQGPIQCNQISLQDDKSHQFCFVLVLVQTITKYIYIYIIPWRIWGLETEFI